MIRRGFPPAHASVPNLAPMIDVVMVILIFFMLGTSFAVTEGRLGTNLFAPAVSDGKAVAWTPVIRVHLLQGNAGGDCRIQIMGTELSPGDFGGLTSVLRAKRVAGVEEGNPVVISSERDILYESVVRAMDACRQGGFYNLHISIGEGATISPAP